MNSFLLILVDIFHFMSSIDIVTLTDTENYQSMWSQTHCDVTDKNNNVSFEGLDIHYH